MACKFTRLQFIQIKKKQIICNRRSFEAGLNVQICLQILPTKFGQHTIKINKKFVFRSTMLQAFFFNHKSKKRGSLQDAG